MFGKFFLPALAVLGVVLAVYSVVTGQREVPPAQPVTQPAQPHFDSYVAGAGIVEASTENIAVGTFVPGVVADVFVKVGDQVEVGAPLFRVDDRDLRAELAVRKAALESAQARVKTETASLADVKSQLKLWESVTDTRAVSKEELDRRRYAVEIQEAKLAQARADFESADAQIELTETEIDRRLVKAPVAGELLQVKVRVGEYAPAGVLATPLMLIGNTRALNVRVDVDENDAWRVHGDAAAKAYVRGNRDISADLKFVRIEPYVIPKRSLTGDSTERVDTRVLQVIYGFDRRALPIYVGQQMDVFIDAPPTSAKVAAVAAVAAGKD
jgi:multidrug resistance efflux pump